VDLFSIRIDLAGAIDGEVDLCGVRCASILRCYSSCTTDSGGASAGRRACGRKARGAVAVKGNTRERKRKEKEREALLSADTLSIKIFLTFCVVVSGADS
jgi:hypothetical protein